MGKRERAAQLLEASGLGALLRGLAPWRGLLVLNYHRIGDGSRSPFDRELWSATPEALDAQLAFLQRHVDLLGPSDLDQALLKRHGRQVLLTFDDGYRDNYQLAFPILKSRGVHAIFFLSTGFLDRPHPSWWDEIAWMVRQSPRMGLSGGAWLPAPLAFDEPEREQAVRALLATYKALPGERTQAYLDFLAEATGSGRCAAAAQETWMTWDMVREMRAAAMGVGGHTVNHPVLARLTPEQQQEEIGGCGRRIEAEVGERMRFFSYPVGLPDAFNEETRSCLAAHGVQFAFSFYGGHQRFDNWQDYDIRRAAVGQGMSQHLFRAQVTMPGAFARW